MAWGAGVLYLILAGFFKKGAGPVERLQIDPTSPWWGEHRSRYRFAQAYFEGKVVLDVACGTGFGCDMICRARAKLVVGVDINLEGLRTGFKHFNSGSVKFVRADGIALPFRDGSFDVVTSFETIEHVADYLTLLREIRRVLKHGGRIILSTPNALITSRFPPNPFHVREFQARELHDLLLEFFRCVELRGQRASPSYRLVPFLPSLERKLTLVERAYLLLWKVANRLPFQLKDLLALAITRRHFYPTEVDYAFEEDAVDEAPTLIATGVV